MVDVSNRSDVDMGFATIIMLFCHIVSLLEKVESLVDSNHIFAIYASKEIRINLFFVSLNLPLL